MDLGHKVAVMVRLIGAAVNDVDRPQEFTDGKKTPQNLHILMNWQKQGSDWKLLSRAATKL
jgi:hypothetical protein